MEGTRGLSKKGLGYKQEAKLWNYITEHILTVPMKKKKKKKKNFIFL